jgi:monoamine oxidase
MTFTQGENNRGKIIQTFAIGQQARRIAAMSESGRKSFVLEQLGPVFEGRLTADNIDRIVPKFWEQDPWALGAYPYFTTEQFLSLTDIAEPEGRIYFAGEHTSPYTGFIEGALESGRRAAKEIKAKQQ